VREGEECRGGTEPRHQIVHPARAQADLAQHGLQDHQHEDPQNEKRREVSRGVVDEVEKPAHYLIA
jgi:hypothetical protein